MICCFRSSSRHAIQTGVSELKIISLYLVMVSLIASSISSYVFIRFRRGIFNFFSSSNSDALFIYYQFYNPPIRLQKSFKLSFFYTSKNPSSSSSSLTVLHCWFSASVYDNFYLICIQNQSLIQPLHCNVCYNEHLHHENLSLCVPFTFSAYQ